MMLFGATTEPLEIRREGDGSRIVAGRFPYNRRAILSDGGQRGRPQKEAFASRAFGFSVEQADNDIPLLVGHDFAKPLASRRSGTMTLSDDDDALSFEARISPQIAETSHGRDALALLTAGLATGLSPGFRVPPERAVPNAVTVEEEPDNPAAGQNRAVIRTINAAILYELSIVTRPAFEEAQVEARSWSPSGGYNMAALAGDRWRHCLGRLL